MMYREKKGVKREHPRKYGVQDQDVALDLDWDSMQLKIKMSWYLLKVKEV